MTFWQSVWAEISRSLTPVAIVAVFFVVVGLIGRGWLSNWFSKKLKNHETELERVTQVHKSQLDRAAYEHQIRFSWLHQEQAKVIAKTYKYIRDLENQFQEVLDSLDEPFNTHEIAPKYGVQLTFQEFDEYFAEHRIYLEESLCVKIDNFASSVNWAGINYDECISNVDYYYEFLTSLQSELLKIRKELEDEFRAILKGSECSN